MLIIILLGLRSEQHAQENSCSPHFIITVTICILAVFFSHLILFIRTKLNCKVTTVYIGYVELDRTIPSRSTPERFNMVHLIQAVQHSSVRCGKHLHQPGNHFRTFFAVGVQGISQRFYGSYGLEGKAVAFLWHAEILVVSENVRIPKHPYLQAFVVKHAVYIM